MRKIIIDTDTGTDDAVALIMALLEPDIDILGITTLCGNVPLENATKNALQCIEECNADIPVYEGAYKPLYKDLVTASYIHGKDGMGDQGLIHPTRISQKKHAVEFILESVSANPGEVEIVALGPATNIALAILKDSETMQKTKCIWSMGTAGFGKGNVTPVAEFNVFVDAESYDIMLNSGIPVTIAGFDLCQGDAALNDDDFSALSQSDIGKFVVGINKTRCEYTKSIRGSAQVDLPDAVAMAAAIWPEIVTKKISAHCYCCTKEAPSYGQVIIYDIDKPCFDKYDIPETNSTVIESINPFAFKKRLLKTLSAK